MNENNSVKINRDHQMDNIKAVLLFLVAFGHTLDVYKGDWNINMYLMKYIYLFHMPLFAFITGYFTKNMDKARDKAIQKCLIPYILFQLVYILMGKIMIYIGVANFNSNVFNGSLLVPSSAFYYLLAVFVWKLIAKEFMNLRHPLILSVLLGVAVSITKMQEVHMGYGAVFALLPFFVLGVLCSKDMIAKIRNAKKIFGITILVISIIPAVVLPYSIHSVRSAYANSGFDNLTGIFYRLIFYTIAVLIGYSVINLMSQKKTIFTHTGEASILVYAGSTFLAPHGYIILDKIFNFSRNNWFNLIAMITYCIILIWICSIPIFLKWYNAILSKINSILFKKDC